MIDSDRYIVAITGASGSIYAIRTLRMLATFTGNTSLIISKAALQVFAQEFDILKPTTQIFLDYSLKGLPLKSIQQQFTIEDIENIGARPASGSALYKSMAIVPCSMKTLSSIAIGSASNLIERAADVMLKERRSLVLVPRETPLSIIHLDNMRKVTVAGGVVLPAMPGFYHKPATIEELGDFIAWRLLSLMGLPVNSELKWEGMENNT